MEFFEGKIKNYKFLNKVFEIFRKMCKLFMNMNNKRFRHTSLGILFLALSITLSSAATHTVQKGDTFAKIARSKGISLSELLKANRISNPNKIVLGQRVVIPGGAAKTEKTPAKGQSTGGDAAKKKTGEASLGKEKAKVTAPVDPKKPATAGTHTVKAGDTLYSLKRRYGMGVDEIAKLNGISPDAPLKAGRVLKIGKAGATSAAAEPVVAKPVTPAKVMKPAVAPGDEPAVSQRSGQHEIQRGETFNGVARAYSLSGAELAKANPGVDPARLRTGQLLKIPDAAVPAATRAGNEVREDGRVMAPRPDPLALAADSPARTQRSRSGYLVEDGDTLRDLARRFYTSEQHLRRMNRMSEFDTVHAGQYILVPFYKNQREGREGTTVGEA